MKKLLMALAAAGCIGYAGAACEQPAVTVTSPDGRNTIRLYEAPLRYEVLRDGVRVVAKSQIGLRVNGECLAKDNRVFAISDRSGTGRVQTPVYKKAWVDLMRTEKFADFGAWGVGLVARNDGVAYRFETKMPGRITVNDERAGVKVPDGGAKCWVNRTGGFGQEESVCQSLKVSEVTTDGPYTDAWKGEQMVYLPFVYTVGGKTVAVTESDVRDYPIWNLVRAPERCRCDCDASVSFSSLFERWPAKTYWAVDGEGYRPVPVAKGGRWQKITDHCDYLVETDGTRTFPWRTFILADRPSQLCESDAVAALARAASADDDFAWVKPGKVAWDWWNCFDNQGPEGCNTKTYERFIDFAAKSGVEYVIFDEGWSERLNIWKFHPNVDVPHLIKYAGKKGVGIILWMAWAQIVGDEARVAEHFAKLGAKGFKVDFMDRGDAAAERFLWTFAEECRKNRMIIDYHGVHRPTGLSRTFPNVVNYEGIHGNEQMKWYDNSYDILANDVRAFYCRLTAGPMDYTPGAMRNFPVDGEEYAKRDLLFPGTLGTRCRQMAMMALYEAPLQMLCDSPSNYEKNAESFAFMAATPVVWDRTVGIGGCPDCYAAVARQAKDGSWYAAAISNREARDITVDTAFLGEGEWKAEIFRDAEDSAAKPMAYVCETRTVKAGDKLAVKLAPGGGFVARFTR